MDPRGYFIIEVIIDKDTINEWLELYVYHNKTYFWDSGKNAIHCYKLPREYFDYDTFTRDLTRKRCDERDDFSGSVDVDAYMYLRNDVMTKREYLRKPCLIKLTYMSPDDQPIASTTGIDVQKLCDFAMPYISEISHAMYLGRELQRAKNCIEKGESYEQP